MNPVKFVLALVLVFPAAVAADTFATLGEARMPCRPQQRVGIDCLDLSLESR